MNQFVQVEVLDPEEAARRLAEQQAAQETRERARLAAENRAKGYAKPSPGDHLYVMSARGIPQRSRAGCTFNHDKRVEVVVVEDGQPIGPTMDGATHTGGYSVDVNGAEMILADNALSVTTQGATEFDASELRKQLAAKDAEIERLKATHARELRDARMGAKDTGDGRPARLDAARKVKGGTDPDFGADK
jgi:hypothetical protein